MLNFKMEAQPEQLPPNINSPYGLMIHTSIYTSGPDVICISDSDFNLKCLERDYKFETFKMFAEGTTNMNKVYD